MNRADPLRNERLLAFDRGSGALTGAGLVDKLAVLALQTGSAITRPLGHLGYSLGCKTVSGVVAKRDIVVALNHDASFAIPFGDGYWSRILNRRYDYEEEIEALLKSAAGLQYTLIDCGANFGYWSVLATSKPFGAQTALAIEASPENAQRLGMNARLNGNRFRCLNAAIGGSAGYALITGNKHEALAAVPVGRNVPNAIRMVSLDSLVEEGLIDPAMPLLVKLDVEGFEIEALRGAEKLLTRDTVVICEEHGSDSAHVVSRHLLNETALKVYVFDPAISRFVPVGRPEVLDRIKRHRWVGYNVFATSSELWQEQLLSATWRYR